MCRKPQKRVRLLQTQPKTPVAKKSAYRPSVHEVFIMSNKRHLYGQTVTALTQARVAIVESPSCAIAFWPQHHAWHEATSTDTEVNYSSQLMQITLSSHDPQPSASPVHSHTASIPPTTASHGDVSYTACVQINSVCSCIMQIQRYLQVYITLGIFLVHYFSCFSTQKLFTNTVAL
jgi:hypothetical protein